MPAACGLACEVCRFPAKGLCPIGRCVPGTDPKAPEKLEKFKTAMGHHCFILECAINKKVDYCFKKEVRTFSKESETSLYVNSH